MTINETFEQVLGYMTAHESGDAEDAFFDRVAWRELIVRLRAAHEREVSAKIMKQREINKELVDEMATLKAALKPVLECDVSQARKFSVWHDAFNVVREAQRIYKDGKSASDAKGDFQENLERKGGE